MSSRMASGISAAAGSLDRDAGLLCGLCGEEGINEAGRSESDG